MRDLVLVGLSTDRGHVLFRCETGECFRVPIDDALLDVLRPAQRRNQARRQVGTSMDGATSILRPRDIQARIRAGESPEAVAAVAEVSVERVMAYAVPVLAERDHVCQQARRSGLRRKHASGPGRTLGLAVDEHLQNNGWNPEQASWDSWRREDGRWSVTVSPSRGGEPATFLFDLPGRYVFANDDAARRLVGDEPPLSVEPDPDEPRQPVRAVQALTDLSDELSPDVAVLDAEAAVQPEEQPARVSALDRLRRQRASRVDADADPGPDTLDGSAGDTAEAEAPEPAGDDVEAIARVMSVSPPPRTAPPKRKGRRASVPSWDEIMFGSKPQG